MPPMDDSADLSRDSMLAANCVTAVRWLSSRALRALFWASNTVCTTTPMSSTITATVTAGSQLSLDFMVFSLVRPDSVKRARVCARAGPR
jgi:hypothetical protein